MSKIRGLAWDDDLDYMLSLKKRLSAYSIDLEICDDDEAFSDKFLQERFDFVVLDIFDDRRRRGPVGADLAKHVALQLREPWYPIIVLTNNPTQLDRNALDLPDNATLKMKSNSVWVARYIKEELVLRGVFVDRQRVFLIHNVESVLGHNIERLKERLKERQLNWDELHLSSIRSAIADGLLGKMNECAAIIAVCTPDIELTSNSFLPDQRVLIGIGLVLGLSRGIDRLLVLKHQNASLPFGSDLHELRFNDSVFEVLEELEARLQTIGVDVVQTPDS